MCCLFLARRLELAFPHFLHYWIRLLSSEKAMCFRERQALDGLCRREWLAVWMLIEKQLKMIWLSNYQETIWRKFSLNLILSQLSWVMYIKGTTAPSVLGCLVTITYTNILQLLFFKKNVISTSRQSFIWIHVCLDNHFGEISRKLLMELEQKIKVHSIWTGKSEFPSSQLEIPSETTPKLDFWLGTFVLVF